MLFNLLKKTIIYSRGKYWDDSRPSPIHFFLNKFPLSKFNQIEKITTLNFDHLSKLMTKGLLPRAIREIKGQLYLKHKETNKLLKISPVQNDDQELLKNSYSSIPIEVARVKVFGKYGECIISNLIKGNMSGSISKEEIETGIHKSIFQAKKEGWKISKVQVSHTHLSFEYITKLPSRTYYYFNGLSKSDMRVGNELSQFLDYPLTIRSVLPSGLCYSYTF
jgi:hypothetical protein